MTDVTSQDVDIQISLLETVCDALMTAVIVYDKNDIITFVSRHITNYLPSLGERVFVGMRLRDFLNTRYDCEDVSSQNIASGRKSSREEWIAERLAAHWKEKSEHLEKRGSDRWYRYVKKRLPSGIGMCVITDVSEQKKREEQWRADLERLQLTEEILDNIPFPVVVKDRNLTYVAVNKATCDMMEVGPEAMLGRTVFDIHSHELASRIDAMDRRILETGQSSTIPEHLTKIDGEHALLITRKQRVGKPGRYFLVTTMEDVTALSVTDETGEPVLPGMRHLPFVKTSHKGRPVEKREEPDFAARLKGCRILFVSPDQGVRDNASHVFACVEADYAAASSFDEQVTFLDVATSSGVAIDLVVVDSNMSHASLDIAKQYGLSVLTLDAFQIQQDLVRHIYNFLATTSQANTLSSVKETAADNAIKTARPKTQTSVIDVLVVEDNEVNKIVFSQILESLNVGYKVAGSGEEALRMIDAHSPSLVLVDATLPDFDGFELARRIRSAEGDSKKIPLIGVIAHAFDGDRRACLDAGMDDMILKPVSPDMIETVLRRFLPSSNTATHSDMSV
ncbi:response regulator [Rhizobium sp. CG4]|uniref:response regulator n=1 Tax=Rhizobium sp. CG4 TaxID=2726075 RepID=UPI00203352CF|nr:response regulator [Rhizobium sp. CG4]MCM2456335.1 response regulator [Rhizobium sp. CG4]